MSLSLDDRFWRHVERRGFDECWPWRAAHQRYGQFRLQAGELGVEKRCNRGAHCVAYALVHGRWPDPHGLHGCDFPLCCNAENPAHVHEGTQLQNVRECIERGRAVLVQQLAGEGNSNAGLTNAQARQVRDLFAAGALLRELALVFPVSATQLGQVVRGKTYKGAGGPVFTGDLRAIRSGRVTIAV